MAPIDAFSECEIAKECDMHGGFDSTYLYELQNILQIELTVASICCSTPHRCSACLPFLGRPCSVPLGQRDSEQQERPSPPSASQVCLHKQSIIFTHIVELQRSKQCQP